MTETTLHPVFQQAIAPFVHAAPTSDFLRYHEIVREWEDAQPSPSAAGVEVAMMLSMAEDIVTCVRRLEHKHRNLNRAVGTRFEPHGIAMVFIDGVDLEPSAADVLTAMVERKIPAPRRG